MRVADNMEEQVKTSSRTTHAESKHLQNFTIPKIKRTVDKSCLLRCMPNRREFGDILETLNNGRLNIVSELKSTWAFSEMKLVINEYLTEKFFEKRNEMKELGRHNRELEYRFCFLVVPTHTANDIALHGLSVGSMAAEELGNPEMGVYLFRYIDVALNFAHQKKMSSNVVLIFKVLFGKVKTVKPGSALKSVLEPTPNFDSHISKKAPLWNDPLDEQVTNSLIYVYEYDKSFKPVKTPRQCLPIATVDATFIVNKTVTATLPARQASKPIVSGDSTPANCTVAQRIGKGKDAMVIFKSIRSPLAQTTGIETIQNNVFEKEAPSVPVTETEPSCCVLKKSPLFQNNITLPDLSISLEQNSVALESLITSCMVITSKSMKDPRLVKRSEPETTSPVGQQNDCSVFPENEVSCVIEKNLNTEIPCYSEDSFVEQSLYLSFEEKRVYDSFLVTEEPLVKGLNKYSSFLTCGESERDSDIKSSPNIHTEEKAEHSMQMNVYDQLLGLSASQFGNESKETEFSISMSLKTLNCTSGHEEKPDGNRLFFKNLDTPEKDSARSIYFSLEGEAGNELLPNTLCKEQTEILKKVCSNDKLGQISPKVRTEKEKSLLNASSLVVEVVDSMPLNTSNNIKTNTKVGKSEGHRRMSLHKMLKNKANLKTTNLMDCYKEQSLSYKKHPLVESSLVTSKTKLLKKSKECILGLKQKLYGPGKDRISKAVTHQTSKKVTQNKKSPMESDATDKLPAARTIVLNDKKPTSIADKCLHKFISTAAVHERLTILKGKDKCHGEKSPEKERHELYLPKAVTDNAREYKKVHTAAPKQIILDRHGGCFTPGNLTNGSGSKTVNEKDSSDLHSSNKINTRVQENSHFSQISSLIIPTNANPQSSDLDEAVKKTSVDKVVQDLCSKKIKKVAMTIPKTTHKDVSGENICFVTELENRIDWSGIFGMELDKVDEMLGTLRCSSQTKVIGSSPSKMSLSPTCKVTVSLETPEDHSSNFTAIVSNKENTIPMDPSLQAPTDETEKHAVNCETSGKDFKSHNGRKRHSSKHMFSHIRKQRTSLAISISKGSSKKINDNEKKLQRNKEFATITFKVAKTSSLLLSKLSKILQKASETDSLKLLQNLKLMCKNIIPAFIKAFEKKQDCGFKKVIVDRRLFVKQNLKTCFKCPLKPQAVEAFLELQMILETRQFVENRIHFIEGKPTFRSLLWYDGSLYAELLTGEFGYQQQSPFYSAFQEKLRLNPLTTVKNHYTQLSEYLQEIDETDSSYYVYLKYKRELQECEDVLKRECDHAAFSLSIPFSCGVHLGDTIDDLTALQKSTLEVIGTLINLPNCDPGKKEHALSLLEVISAKIDYIKTSVTTSMQLSLFGIEHLLFDAAKAMACHETNKCGGQTRTITKGLINQINSIALSKLYEVYCAQSEQPVNIKKSSSEILNSYESSEYFGKHDVFYFGKAIDKARCAEPGVLKKMIHDCKLHLEFQSKYFQILQECIVDEVLIQETNALDMAENPEKCTILLKPEAVEAYIDLAMTYETLHFLNCLMALKKNQERTRGLLWYDASLFSDLIQHQYRVQSFLEGNILPTAIDIIDGTISEIKSELDVISSCSNSVNYTYAFQIMTRELSELSELKSFMTSKPAIATYINCSPFVVSLYYGNSLGELSHNYNQLSHYLDILLSAPKKDLGKLAHTMKIMKTIELSKVLLFKPGTSRFSFITCHVLHNRKKQNLSIKGKIPKEEHIITKFTLDSKNQSQEESKCVKTPSPESIISNPVSEDINNIQENKVIDELSKERDPSVDENSSILSVCSMDLNTPEEQENIRQLNSTPGKQEEIKKKQSPTSNEEIEKSKSTTWNSQSVLPASGQYPQFPVSTTPWQYSLYGWYQNSNNTGGITQGYPCVSYNTQSENPYNRSSAFTVPNALQYSRNQPYSTLSGQIQAGMFSVSGSFGANVPYDYTASLSSSNQNPVPIPYSYNSNANTGWPWGKYV
ncbi:hypothetical protein GDO81_000958 [Engystomops pustulosus]|uniref:Uncharacterized protein n=1 Tax=Engystomops pustulosus TaxID=76066 RepID=A0AAV7D8N7_ENGPU|nr:hypothetical protein GDO81_000958 [Engystomops pustulosus]